MSRDFILVLGGGVVSLVTTLVVLFITDFIYRHDQARAKSVRQPHGTPKASITEESKS